jgi:hypothetical protein
MRFGLLSAAIAVCALLTACGSASTQTNTRASVHAARRHAAHHARHHFPEYAGIGATIGDFTHDNNMFCLSCSLSPGEAAYTIKGRRNGRVTEYDVAEDFKPAAGAAVRLSLVSGTMIPGPITAPVRQSADCIDYRVPQLKKLIGLEYAEASTSPGVNFATMQAVATPTCP